MSEKIRWAELMPSAPVFREQFIPEASMATQSLRHGLSSFSVVVAIAMVVSMVFCMGAARAADANAAQAFVQQNIDKANALLDDASMPAEQRRMEFGRLLLAMADTRRIATFALGPYANGAMPDQ